MNNGGGGSCFPRTISQALFNTEDYWQTIAAFLSKMKLDNWRQVKDYYKFPHEWRVALEPTERVWQTVQEFHEFLKSEASRYIWGGLVDIAIIGAFLNVDITLVTVQ